MPSISISTTWPGLERVLVGRDDARCPSAGPSPAGPGCRARPSSTSSRGVRFICAVDVSPANSSAPSRVGDPQPDRERRVPVVRHGERRPDRAGAGEDLGLRDVERVRALDVAARDVVADRHRDRLARPRRARRRARAPAPSSSSRCAPGSTPPGPDRAPHRGVLQEELGPVGVVDEGVDVARVGLRLLEPRVAAALVRDAGAPDLGRVDRRRAASSAGERRRRADARPRRAAPRAGRRGRAARRSSPSSRPARGPFRRSSARTKRLNTSPGRRRCRSTRRSRSVISSLASQQISAATSAGSPIRPSGMRAVM